MARLENNQDSSSHGGARKGAGRKAGSATKKTREIADKAASEGITPLEYMLNVMRTESPDFEDVRLLVAHRAMQFEAARAAAPYVHARLAAVELKGGLRLTKTDLSDEDLAAIATGRGA